MKVCKPFWSYDPIKTEKWLSEQAKNGFQLEGINRWLRIFYFKKSPKQPIIEFHINYQKEPKLPRTLHERGWTLALQAGKWTIYQNQTDNDSQLRPTRDGLLKKNRLLKRGYMIYLGYLAFVLMFMMTFLGISWFVNGELGEMNRVDSPLWALTYTLQAAGIILMVISIYSVIKIKNVENRIDGQQDLDLIKREDNDNHNSSQDFITITRWKFGWQYAPDKLVDWLEEKGQNGYQLLRINKLGTKFTFKKTTDKRTRYAVDFQRRATSHYETIHHDAGWVKEFSTKGQSQKWTIWSKEYEVDEEVPQFYSENLELVNQAKSVLKNYALWFVPLIIMYLYLIVQMSSSISTSDASPIQIINFFIFILVIISFCSIIFKCYSYYRRLKRRIS